ncbi:DNA topoisomerase IB [Echinicola soli]|uniref:DNA topoisomerase n=1 Tax=Echinicola soli TaxID=2591634 RepID=A0A514CKK6_9BACT|nr:DNA topoisomerase IB [Echinicola soli]QDH80342.1 DNA topoisomerase IB [Echinicola soli]
MEKLTQKKLTLLSRENEQCAEIIGLRYIDSDDLGIRRIRRGKGFSYHYTNGKKVENAGILKRIKALVIPPAWTEVWICESPKGHIQATGYDKKDRKQYLYHSEWITLRSQTKFSQLYPFGLLLPHIKKAISEDLSVSGLPLQRVLATVVSLLLKLHARIGNEYYEEENGSYGLTTLKQEHVTIHKDKMMFSFPGKKGIVQELSLRHKQLAHIVRKCRNLPGEALFKHIGAEHQSIPIDSEMVNTYIKNTTGGPYTAKDLRTWSGSVLAVEYLIRHQFPSVQEKREEVISAVISKVADRLSNTKSICEKYYIHPVIFEYYRCNKWKPALDVGNKDFHHSHNRSEKVLLNLLKDLA